MTKSLINKEMKGTWIVDSDDVVELEDKKKKKKMESRSMVLYANRNTRTTKGNFIVRELWGKIVEGP